jgi:hypothetical protein
MHLVQETVAMQTGFGIVKNLQLFEERQAGRISST